LFLEELETRLLLSTSNRGMPPIISGIPTEIVAPGAYSAPIGFFVSDPQEGSLEVTATVSGANPADALSNTDIVLAGFGDTRTVQIFDSEDVVGSATVTLTAFNPVTRLRAQSAFTVVVDIAPSLTLPDGMTYSQANTQFPLAVPVDASSSLSRPVTVTGTVTANPLLYGVEQRYAFTGVGYANFGAAAYVLQSDDSGPGVNGDYLIRPSDGAVFPYDGSGSYAHSFANGTALATLGANVYTDPGLLLNAQAPIDYTTLYGIEQQYQFQPVGYAVYGAAAYVLQASANNNFGNPDYLLRPTDGALFPYDGSGSYAHTFANVAPVQFDGASVILGANVYNNPSLLTNAGATPATYAQLYQLNQQYDLQEPSGGFLTNMYGHQAEWLYSPVLNQYGEHWYTLTLQTVNSQPQAVLTAWEGYQDSEVGAVVADLDPSVYNNPGWLVAATAEPEPPAGADTVDTSGNLIVNLPSSNFVGTFMVVVTASDGLASTSQTLTVTDTDSTPTLTVQQNAVTVSPGSTVSVPHSSFPETFAVSTTGGNSPVTESTSVSTYDQLFALEQQYRFQGLGSATYGASAYVLQAAGNNGFGNPDYLLRPSDGALFAYDGSGSYAHTFANVTPIASLGAVVAADPTLLTSALAPVDYASLYNLQQQYQFQGIGYANFGAAAYVLKTATNNSYGNPYYLIATNGGLYAYDGSGSYSSSFANSANFVAQLDPSLYVNPSALLGAEAAPAVYLQLQAVEQTYDLRTVGFAVYGAPADVLQSVLPNVNGNDYYLLSSSGGLYTYDGSGSYASTFANNANLVANLDASVYANPSLLADAKAPLAATVGGAPVTVSQPSGTPASFTLNAPTDFVGMVSVTVTATDGSLSTTQSFLVSSTDSAPVPNTIPPQTASASGSPLRVTLSATDSENDPITYSAAVEGYSSAYNLQQQYRFQGLGYATSSDNVSAYVLSVNGLNINGNPYYLLNSSGALYAYDGSGSYGHTFANGANLVAQLSPNDYTTPTLLTNAQAPTAPPAIASVSGNTLTINVSSVHVGTVFQVIVTANDGAEIRRTSFLVTVTA
jgi:hypothetical protein